MDAGDEGAVFAEVLQDRLASPRHDVHVDDDVRGVGDLDAVLGDGVANRAHGEGDDVHHAALHAAGVSLGHLRFHFHRIHPVVGRAGVDLALRADERAAFHSRHVAFVGACEVTVWALLGIKLDELALFHHHLADREVLFSGALHDHDLLGLTDLVPFVHPREHFSVRELRGFDGCHYLFS